MDRSLCLLTIQKNNILVGLSFSLLHFSQLFSLFRVSFLTHFIWTQLNCLLPLLISHPCRPHHQSSIVPKCYWDNWRHSEWTQENNLQSLLAKHEKSKKRAGIIHSLPDILFEWKSAANYSTKSCTAARCNRRGVHRWRLHVPQLRAEWHAAVVYAVRYSPLRIVIAWVRLTRRSWQSTSVLEHRRHTQLYTLVHSGCKSKRVRYDWHAGSSWQWRWVSNSV